MPKIVAQAHVMDLRSDLVMVRHGGGSHGITLTPEQCGRKDFADLGMGTKFDVYDDDTYVVSGEPYPERPEPAEEPAAEEPAEPVALAPRTETDDAEKD